MRAVPVVVSHNQFVCVLTKAALLSVAEKKGWIQVDQHVNIQIDSSGYRNDFIRVAMTYNAARFCLKIAKRKNIL